MEYKKCVPTLFRLSMRKVSQLIFDACYRLNGVDNPVLFDALLSCNQFLREFLAETILNTLHLEMGHAVKFRPTDRCSFYHLVATLHPNVRQLIAQSHIFPIGDWSYILENYGQHLIRLDLSKCCNDEILELVPRYCPVLRDLDATGQFVRIAGNFNALAYDTTVSDRGIAWLSQCKHLQELTLLQPRSPRCRMRRQEMASLTHTGLRRLLRDVPTLVSLSCCALGSVLAVNMEDVPELNLREVHQLNAKPIHLQETFRMCRKLERLELTFFNDSFWTPARVTGVFEHCPPTVRTMILSNMYLDTRLPMFFRMVGASLSRLELSNRALGRHYTFADLVVIGQSCPKLISLVLSDMNMRADEVLGLTANVGQFAKLQNISVTGHDLCLRKVLTFCAQNTVDLTSVYICDINCDTRIVNDNVLNYINMHSVELLSLIGKLEFSLNGIQRLKQQYPALKIISVYCNEPNEIDLKIFLKETLGLMYIKPRALT